MSGEHHAAFSPERLELARQRIGPLGDVAGAEADHVVAGLGDALDEAGEILRLLERHHVAVAARLEAGDEAVAVGARDRLLAGRVDRRDDDRVGIVEAGAELVEQGREARVAVRLHHGDDLPVRRGAGGLQHRGDLDRMVAVIVEDRDAVPLARAGEAALHAAEARERLADRVGRDAELVRDRDGGGGVERVVRARHRQDEVLELQPEARAAVADHDAELGLPAARIDIHEAHIGLRVLAIGDDAAVLDAADEVLHGRMVDAHHREAVERDVVDEGAEGVLDGVEGAEMVEMLGVDVGDDGDVRRAASGRCRRIRPPPPPSTGPSPMRALVP